MSPRPGPTAIPHIPRPAALDAGLCASHPHPEWWHPGEHQSHLYVHARRVCAVCPARAACLEYALAVESPSRFLRHGMWGGTTPVERHAIARTTFADRRTA